MTAIAKIIVDNQYVKLDVLYLGERLGTHRYWVDIDGNGVENPDYEHIKLRQVNATTEKERLIQAITDRFFLANEEKPETPCLPYQQLQMSITVFKDYETYLNRAAPDLYIAPHEIAELRAYYKNRLAMIVEQLDRLIQLYHLERDPTHPFVQLREVLQSIQRAQFLDRVQLAYGPLPSIEAGETKARMYIDRNRLILSSDVFPNLFDPIFREQAEAERAKSFYTLIHELGHAYLAWNLVEHQWRDRYTLIRSNGVQCNFGKESPEPGYVDVKAAGTRYSFTLDYSLKPMTYIYDDVKRYHHLYPWRFDEKPRCADALTRLSDELYARQIDLRMQLLDSVLQLSQEGQVRLLQALSELKDKNPQVRQNAISVIVYNPWFKPSEEMRHYLGIGGNAYDRDLRDYVSWIDQQGCVSID